MSEQLQLNGSRVLVVGATGQLGRAIVRHLVAAGATVRAAARDRTALAALGPGVEIAPVDFLDLARLTEACRDVDQIVATANNNMGKGATSPMRVDLAGYQNLCAAARNMRIRRLIYTSYRGVSQDSPVDIFRLKWYIEDAIRRSGVPCVMLRPTAFMDVWIDDILGKGIREKGVATIFGDGHSVANYIAVEDVAAFAVKILSRPEVVNEAVDAGGPSNVSQNDLVALVERRLNVRAKRRHVPVPALRLLPHVVRPFNEVAARLMTLGLYAATRSAPFPEWKVSADRFGIAPRTVETFIDQMH
ncbi:MAG: SDR family oxidoreductase [Vicinamibacterales bacterium]